MRRAFGRKGRLLALVAASLLVGCATPGVDVHRYVLTADAASGTAAPHGAIAIGVGPVAVPPYLDREELVTRIGPNELRATDTHRWGEDLEQGLARVVAANLAVRLPGSQARPFPWPEPLRADYRVAIGVDRFERMPDGSVALDAHWVISRRGETGPEAEGDAAVREPTASAAPTDTVAAMSRAAARLSDQIATAIRSRQGVESGS
jgi:uncharacterized lipoprotein YmbA